MPRKPDGSAIFIKVCSMNNNKPQMLRVLEIHCGDFTTGGIEQYIVNLFRNAGANDIIIDVFTPYKVDYDGRKDDISYLTQHGGRIFEGELAVRKFPYFSAVRDMFPIYRSVVRCIKNSGATYDAVHIGAAGGIFLAIAAAAAARCHVPNICVHAHSANNPAGNKLYQQAKIVLTKRAITRRATKRFACSNAAGVSVFGDKVPFTVQNNGIDIKRFAFDGRIREEQRRLLGLENSFVIGHIGRFTAQKNHELLINIFAEVRKTEETAVLLLIGTGDLQQQIQARVDSLGLSEYVRFLGSTNEPEKFYQAMDVFCLPSLFEGLPFVAVEAQCSGLPVVCSTAVTKEAAVVPGLFARAHDVQVYAGLILDKKALISERRDRSADVKAAGYDMEDCAARVFLEMELTGGRDNE